MTVATRPQTPSLPREAAWPYIVTVAVAVALWGLVIGAWVDPQLDAGWAILFALALIPEVLIFRHRG